ncbi:MAG: hypothetical protein EBV83_09590, partial [Verrucomicrobia bacterium]|nr:hypothetical protein [Verrucomicrobiota bacterium]
KITDTAIIRFEQIYPLHTQKLLSILSRHSPEAEIVWCQEESENMGAWSHLALKLQNLLGKPIRYAGRDASSSPATGSLAIHNLEQALLVQEAFTSASAKPSKSSPPAREVKHEAKTRASSRATGKKKPKNRKKK